MTPVRGRPEMREYSISNSSSDMLSTNNDLEQQIPKNAHPRHDEKKHVTKWEKRHKTPKDNQQKRKG